MLNEQQLNRAVNAARGVEINANAQIRKASYMGYINFEMPARESLKPLIMPLASAIVVVIIAALVDLWRVL